MNRVLVIDNYDSFTYNVVHYLEELGAKTTVFRNDKITCNRIEKMRPRAVVISPGPCTPTEAGISVSLIQRFSGIIPILGICLGHQCIGYAFGGNIRRARRIVHGKTSEIHHDRKGIFKGLPVPFSATRYHSLIVEKKSVPAVLRITAETEKGEIMAIQHRKHPTFGIQFHPESIRTQYGHAVLKNFLVKSDRHKRYVS